MRLRRLLAAAMVLSCGAITLVWLSHVARPAWGQIAPPAPQASLKTVPVPMPTNLSAYVRDEAAAIRLGKALFWEMQVGSDGIQACASCHFHAGADHRLKNQTTPGLLGGSTTFDAGGPNYTLKPSDYLFDTLGDDGVSSQGVPLVQFQDIVPGDPEDDGTVESDPVFHVQGINVRRVEPRNAPTVINAVFNFRSFVDGRAQNDFNGVNPFGSRDVNARILEVQANGDVLPVTTVGLDNSSLASQVVGPPVSNFEMSFGGRTFPKLGKKLLSLRPLAKQMVHPDDSVLGPIASSRIGPSVPGLEAAYADMIEAAFRPEYWDSDKIVTFDENGVPMIMDPPGRPLTTDEFTVMEANFSLFLGLAIQLYESTLISDDAPFDRFMEGDTAALTPQQTEGLDIFTGEGRCIQCHGGAELTNASVAHVSNARLERMTMGDGGLAVYDNGFYNIGVRPTAEDPGAGGLDPFGNPLSDTRMAQIGKFVDPNLDPPIDPGERTAVDGSFKVPGLRNVELTGPYFRNGGRASLLEVMDFYARGGDFSDVNFDDLSPNIIPLGLTEREKEALAAFLKSLTDERVRFERAPFDHPQVFVPLGHEGDDSVVVDDGTGKAVDEFLEIPAVGASGRTEPLRSFAELLVSGQPPTPPPVANPGRLRVTTSPAVPSQISIDGIPRDTWGLNWLKLDPATYEVSFSDVQGFTTPDPQVVTVNEGVTTGLAGVFSQRGFVWVVTNPALPGTISVDGVPRNDWGVWTDLIPATYQVCFGAVEGFIPSPCQFATVTLGSLTMVTGNYIPSSLGPAPSGFGMLRVTTSPALPSQILIDGIPRDTWGLDWLKLPPGSYEVSFSDVRPFATPDPQVVTVTEGATTEVIGPFTLNGYLRVVTSPAVPGTISVGGVPRDDWGMWTDLPPGTHHVCFGEVEGFTVPACQFATLTAGALTEVTGTYAP